MSVVQVQNIVGGAIGDIDGVTAGTGATGGGSSGTVTIGVNVGTGPNQIVQLDGSSKLPAVDGSQLTNISGGGGITTLTGDVTASGTGSVAATIPDYTITNAKMALEPAFTLKGNNTGIARHPKDLIVTDVLTLLGQWQPQGSDIYFDTGRVGIGLEAPNVPLDVYGSDTIANLTSATASGEVDVLVLNSSANTALVIKNDVATTGLMIGNSGGNTVDFQINNREAGGSLAFVNDGVQRIKFLNTGDVQLNADFAFNVSSCYITNVNDPQNPQDAATMNYVDTQVGNHALRDLSNLNSTAINADLVPAADVSYALGSTSNNFAVVNAQALAFNGHSIFDANGQTINDSSDNPIMQWDTPGYVQFDTLAVVLPTATSDPSTGYPNGASYYNTSTNQLRVLNGGVWRGIVLI